MNQQSTLEQLQELKLTGMAKRYEAIINSICGSLNYVTTHHRNRSTVHPAEASVKKYWPTYLMEPSLKNQKTC